MNKLLCYVALLVVSIAHLAICYNFDDSTYNTILYEEYQELHGTHESFVRNRREAAEAQSDKEKCRKGPKLCCADTAFHKLHKQAMKFKKECKELIEKPDKEESFDPLMAFDCKRINQMKQRFVCITECSGQKSNTLDNEGNPKAEEVASALQAAFEDEPWFADASETIISTCLEEAKNASASRDDSTNSCNPAGLALGYCLFREIQLGCPADQISDEKACFKLREHLEGSHHHGHHHHLTLALPME